jgi:hypothetical protein
MGYGNMRSAWCQKADLLLATCPSPCLPKDQVKELQIDEKSLMSDQNADLFLATFHSKIKSQKAVKFLPPSERSSKGITNR